MLGKTYFFSHMLSVHRFIFQPHWVVFIHNYPQPHIVHLLWQSLNSICNGTSHCLMFYHIYFPFVAGIFTVMCYNVLCDKYATRQMYGYCPSWALEWDYRKKGILDEIRHYSADLISLQVSPCLKPFSSQYVLQHSHSVP